MCSIIRGEKFAIEVMRKQQSGRCVLWELQISTLIQLRWNIGKD